jgi:hypothetical protein
MKKVLLTALVAVFLSLTVAGCYTRLKGPEPYTGAETYYDDLAYPYGYYSGYYSHYGWYTPYFMGSPYYYDYFYSPWWYDPYYYYDGRDYDGGRAPSGKDIRRRGSGRGSNSLPPVPGNTYSPPPATGGGNQGTVTPPSQPSQPSRGNSSNNDDDSNDSGGKSTRQRR